MNENSVATAVGCHTTQIEDSVSLTSDPT